MSLQEKQPAKAHPRAALIGWLLMGVSAFFFRPGDHLIDIPLSIGALSFLRADHLSLDPALLALACFVAGAVLLARGASIFTSELLVVAEKGLSASSGKSSTSVRRDALLRVRAGGQPEGCPYDLQGLPDGALRRTEKFLPVPLVIGAALLGALVWVNHASGEVNVSLHMQVLIFCAGVGLCVWGVSGLTLHSNSSPNIGVLKAVRSDVLLLTGITLLALIVRVWALDTAIRAWVDEVLLSTPVTRLVHDEPTRLLHPMGEFMPYPYLFAYAQWWTVEAFGRSYVGLRLVSALIGVLTVPALYLLARTLFDRTTALVAAAVLATFPPHVHFSRIAVINIADPLFGTLALAFLARGLRSNHHIDYALAGALLGMTQYFYEGGRIFYPGLTLGWLAALGVFGIIRFTKPTRRGLLVFGAAALLVAAPLFISNALLADELKYRTSWALREPGYWTHLFEGDHFVNHLRIIADTFLIYVHAPDGSMFYGGDAPLVIPPIVPALLVGAALMLVALRRKSAGALLVLLWVALTSFGNTLLQEHNGAARYVVGFPALALLIAVGLRYGLAPLIPRPPLPRTRGEGEKYHPLKWGMLLPVVVVAVMSVQVAYYFGTHVRVYNTQSNNAPSPNGVDALWRAQHFPPGTYVHLVSGWTPFIPQTGEDLMRYITDGIHLSILQTKDFTRAYVEALPRDVDQAFFLEADDVESYWLVREAFGELKPQFTPYDVPANKAFVLYYAPASKGASEK